MLSRNLKIQTGKCNLCGAFGSVVKGKNFKRCKTCVPDLWAEVAEMEKQKWLQGS